jgi:hypothetical protein
MSFTAHGLFLDGANGIVESGITHSAPHKPRHAEEPRGRVAYTINVDQQLSVADICQTVWNSQATFYRYVALGRRAAEELG